MKPIRGRADCKPLGSGHKTHATIRRDGEAVICRLYNTDVLTYYPDGRLLINLTGWATQSTCAFIESVAGLGVAIRHNRAWVRARPGNNPELGMVALPLRVRGDNWFRSPPSGYWASYTFENPAAVKVHAINRKGANTVRAMYKPFKDYIKTVMKVRDDGFSAQEMGDTFGWAREGMPAFPEYIRITARRMVQIDPVEKLLALAIPTADPDETNANFYKANLWIARSAGTMWATAVRPTESSMLKLLDDCILLKHRDTCFDEIDAEPGKVVRDAYARFF